MKNTYNSSEMDLNLDYKPFLKRLAEEVREKVEINKTVKVVLPNRRSLFVLQSFLNEYSLPDGFVEMITVDQLMEQLSGLTLIEPEELLVAFYGAYSRVEKNAQPFDRFISWAVSFLTDANEVDLHLGNMSELLKQIDDYHSTGYQFADGNPGPLERDYLSFWQRLPKYHEALHQDLSALKLAYRGLIYRTVAEKSENSPNEILPEFAGKTIFWVGIIPGNPSEQKLIKWLDKELELEVFADVDSFYTDNEAHEAGKLFRTSAFANNTKYRVNLLKQKAYEIQVHASPTNVGQLFIAKSILAEIPKKNYRDTVVVLADEKLLSPFLEVFDDWRPNLNITTGFPLKNTLIHRFVMSWIQLHSGAINRADDVMFYHKHLEEFLEYAVIKNWLNGAANWLELQEEVVRKNFKFVSKKWLHGKLKGDLFANSAFDLLFDWTDQPADIFERIDGVLSDWNKNINKIGFAPIERAALPVYVKKLKLLLSQFHDVLPKSDFKSLRKFVHRQVGYAKIYLEEPENDAIQVMGMLETRMIDFKNVVIIGASDDTVPGNTFKPTHIPFIHRLNYGLPTQKESEALISYHFYRLIQRADFVHLIYSASTTALSGGEGTRFILQLKEELTQLNKKAKLSFPLENSSFELGQEQPLCIEKTPEVLADLRKALNRMSPSGLNRFIDSPLEFYYSYILKVKEQEKVEEDIEANTFGTIIHDTIESLYEPLKGQKISINAINKMITRVDEAVIHQFLQKFDPILLERGKNFVQVELAKNWVRQFLFFDIKDIEKHGEPELVGLEMRLGGEFNHRDVQVSMNSFADRIDRRNGKLRIIDYKTGKVESNDLKASWEGIQTNSAKSKALQLAFYKWALSKLFKTDAEQIDTVIFSFRNKREGFIPLVIDQSKSEKLVEFNEGFETILGHLIDEMFDTSLPFMHRDTTKYPVF